MYLTYSIVTGIGYGLLYTSSLLAVIAHFVKRRSVAVGVVSSACSAGLLVVTQSNRILLREFGWRFVFRVMAAVTVLSFIGSLSFHHKTKDKSLDEELKDMVDTTRSKTTSNAQRIIINDPSRGNSFLTSNLQVQCEKESSISYDSARHEQKPSKSKTLLLLKNKPFMMLTFSAVIAGLMYFTFIVHVVSYY